MAFLAAHGNDENGVETGFHLIQGNRGAKFLLDESTVSTVMDGFYHIGFDTKWDHFVNEDGNVLDTRAATTSCSARAAMTRCQSGLRPTS